MSRSSGAGSKTPRGKTTKPARRVAPKVRRIALASQNQLDLRHQLDEALEQQAATAEVLRIIASSPRDLAAVFDAILANAARLCEATFGGLGLFEGEAFRTVATTHDVPPAWVEWRRHAPLLRPNPLTGLARLVRTKEVVHITDYKAEQGYRDGDPLAVATVELLGARALLEVPMLRDGELIGAVVIYRQEVRPFHGQTNRAGPELREPGCHCDRERASPQ